MIKNLTLTQSRSEVDMSEMFSNLTTDIMWRVAFGRTGEGGAGEGQKCNLMRSFKQTRALFAGFCVGDYYPEWKWVNWVSGLNRWLGKGMEALREACDEK